MAAEARLLGRFVLRAGTGETIALPPGKACALFAALAIAPNHCQSREVLATLLWGNHPDRRARGSLRFTLTMLRKALVHSGCPSLFADKDAVWLDAIGLRVDALEFETLASSERANDWENAVDRYQGDFLEGLTVRSEPFEEWVRDHRTRLRDRYERTLDKLLAHAQAIAQEELTVRMAQRLLALDPLREDVHRILIRNFRRQGRIAAALKQYELCASSLRAELNAKPGRETIRLVEDLCSNLTQSGHKKKVQQSASTVCRIRVQPFQTVAEKKSASDLAVSFVESIRFALARSSDFTLAIPSDFRPPEIEMAAAGLSNEAGFVVSAALTVRDDVAEAMIGLAEAPRAPCFWTGRYSFASSMLEDLDSVTSVKIVPSICHFIRQKQLQRLRQIPFSELDSSQLGLLARAEVEKMTRTSLDAAVGLTRRASRAATDGSLAWSMFALARVFQIRMGWADKRSGALSEAHDAAEQALSLDFRDPIAHGVLGLVHLWSGSHRLALNSINRALTFNPARADVMHWKGLVLDFSGEHERAIEHHLKAIDLDSLHGAAFATVNALSGAYYELGDYEQAAACARKSIKLNPRYRRSHAVLAASLAEMGDERGCALALKSARMLDPSLSLRTQLSGFAYKETSEAVAWERGFRKAGLR